MIHHQTSATAPKFSNLILIPLMSPHMHDFRRYAALLTRNRSDADDLFQDSVCRAMLKLHLFQEGTNFPAWFTTIMKRVFLSGLEGSRARHKRWDPIDSVQIPISGGQESAVELSCVASCWPRLTREHRLVLAEVGLYGASYEEAAAILGIPTGTVRSRLSRARQHLRQLVGSI